MAQIALAGPSESDDIASLARDNASLQRQINELKAQVAQGAPARAAKKKKKRRPAQRGPAGPQGPGGAQGIQGPPGGQGAQGAAPACQGNGSGDAMVAAGAVCIDTYENSIWTQPNGGTQLTSEAQYDAACPNNGQPTGGATCTNFYARSVAGVLPATNITWFQAQQALTNSGKQLPTSAEWQQAVSGSPDPGPDNGTTDCNTNSVIAVVNTGSRSACVSRFGAFDMVGNLYEWVADWGHVSTSCPGWGAFSGDDMCVSNPDTDAAPNPGLITSLAAFRRGGFYNSGTGAGPMAVNSFSPPQDSIMFYGFRGAR